MTGVIVFIVWVIVAFVVGAAANQRGRSALAWFMTSLLLSPVLAVLLLIAFPMKRPHREPTYEDHDNDAALKRNAERGRRLEPQFFNSSARVADEGFVTVGPDNWQRADDKRYNKRTMRQALVAAIIILLLIGAWLTSVIR